jgi:phosphoglycerate dehydrogenase-like enzyme
VQAEPLSEFTEACVLAHAKKLPLLIDGARSHNWAKEITLETLSGKVAGLLGLGAVGLAVAWRLHKHGMRVRAIRRNLQDQPSCVESLSGLDGLPEFLAEVDVLVIGLPPIEGIKGLIGEPEFRAMKDTSIVINLVTRGIIPDAALARALKEGWIGGAACNVFETNPLPDDSPLWSLSNLIISPGIAQTDPLRWQKLRKVFTENLAHYLAGAPMEKIVDGERAY